MNKHRKAEARRVKRIVRVMKACGCSVNYRAVRRKMRVYDRSLNNVPRIFHNGLRRLNYGVAEAVRTISHAAVSMFRMVNSGIYSAAQIRERLGLDERGLPAAGYSANTFIIDETPLEAAKTDWPKVNPYDPRFSGVQILRSDGFIKVVTPDD